MFGEQTNRCIKILINHPKRENPTVRVCLNGLPLASCLAAQVFSLFVLSPIISNRYSVNAVGAAAQVPIRYNKLRKLKKGKEGDMVCRSLVE